MMEFIVSMLSSHIGLLCWKDIQLFDGINPGLIMHMKFLFSNTALHMYLPFHYVKCHLIFFTCSHTLQCHTMIKLVDELLKQNSYNFTFCSRPNNLSGFSLYCLDAGHCFSITSAGSALSNSPLSLYFWASLSTVIRSMALLHDSP